MTKQAFILANTRLRPVPHVPELRLHLADESVPLWSKTEEELGAAGLPPPYWAFAWAGGQALARYVLDHPDEVRERRVLDLAAGSGPRRHRGGKGGRGAGGGRRHRSVRRSGGCAERRGERRLCRRSSCTTCSTAPAPRGPRYDVILVGDLFYERATAERVLAFLQRHAAHGTRVLIGDPGRTYLPKDRLERLAEYSVPVTRELEDQDIKRTGVWRLR